MDITFVSLSVLTTGLVQVIKKVDPPKKLIPILALVIGVAIAFLGGDMLEIYTIESKILHGLIMGLTSMGLWSGGKTLGEKEE